MKPMVGFLLLLTTACIAPTPPAPHNSIVDAAGQTIGQAREESASLKTGMSSDEVKIIFGAPDFTAANTFGQSIGHPWNGIVWTYHWEFWIAPKRFVVNFETDASGALRVNSWDWFDY